MWRRTTVGIDNNFASGQTGITIRATNHELTGWVDQQIISPNHPAFRQDISNDRRDQCANITLRGGFVMLGRQHNFMRACWAPGIIINQADLAL